VFSDIKVGDMIQVDKDKRIPADMILMRTTERQGACFVRTDQLDGETDWKLRVAVTTTQHLAEDADVCSLNGQLYAEKPQRDIHAFVGTLKLVGDNGVQEISLNIENTLWADTVLASGTSAIGCVVYTGRETRSAMNTNQPHSKVRADLSPTTHFTQLTGWPTRPRNQQPH
jgi:phospholipid-translocating ATPase